MRHRHQVIPPKVSSFAPSPFTPFFSCPSPDWINHSDPASPSAVILSTTLIRARPSSIATLELDAQRELASSVPGVLGRLRSAKDTEGCRDVDIRGGRCEVRAVKQIGKCGLEAHFHSFRNVKDPGKTETGRGRARSLEDADSSVTEAASADRSWGKRRQIEVMDARLTLIEIGRDLVGT